MKKPLPLATANDYVKSGDRFFLFGDKFLALPGCATDDPEKGALKYNDNLIRQYLAEQPKKDKLVRIFLDHSQNHRILKIRMLIRNNTPFDSSELTKTELFLMKNILSYGIEHLNIPVDLKVV